jgi:molecular chaperone DnaK (HSP70)
MGAAIRAAILNFPPPETDNDGNFIGPPSIENEQFDNLTVSNLNMINIGKISSIQLIDVTPFSLSTSSFNPETKELFSDFIITRNAQIPCNATKQYFSIQANQKKMIVDCYQGEDNDPKKNHLIGYFHFNLPPNSPRYYKVNVTFLVDINGVIKVEAKDESNVVEQSFDLVLNLKDEAILNSIEKINSTFEDKNFVKPKSFANSVIKLKEEVFDIESLEKQKKKLQEQIKNEEFESKKFVKEKKFDYAKKRVKNKIEFGKQLNEVEKKIKENKK